MSRKQPETYSIRDYVPNPIKRFCYNYRAQIISGGVDLVVSVLLLSQQPAIISFIAGLFANPDNPNQGVIAPLIAPLVWIAAVSVIVLLTVAVIIGFLLKRKKLRRWTLLFSFQRELCCIKKFTHESANTICDLIIRLFEFEYGKRGKITSCLRVLEDSHGRRRYVTIGKSEVIKNLNRKYSSIPDDTESIPVIHHLTAEESTHVLIYTDLNEADEIYPDGASIARHHGESHKPRSMIIGAIYDQRKPGNADLIGILYIKSMRKNRFKPNHIDFVNYITSSLSSVLSQTPADTSLNPEQDAPNPAEHAISKAAPSRKNTQPSRKLHQFAPETSADPQEDVSYAAFSRCASLVEDYLQDTNAIHKLASLDDSALIDQSQELLKHLPKQSIRELSSVNAIIETDPNTFKVAQEAVPGLRRLLSDMLRKY